MLLIYAALIVWILVVAIVISDTTLASLKDIKGEWLPATLCMAIGLGAGLVLSGVPAVGRNDAVRAVFWGLVFHAVLQLGAAAWLLARDGVLPDNFGGISDDRANVTHTNALALAMLIADAMAAALQRVRFLGLSRAAFLVIYGVLLLSTFASASRNGLILFVLLTIIGGGVLLLLNQERHRRGHFGLLVVGGLLILLIGVWLGIKSDPRWQRVLGTIPVAWNIDLKDYLMNPDIPADLKAGNGGELDISVYHRVALARVGWRFFKDHPLGTDATSEAFKRLVTDKYSNAIIGSSHNSYLDLSLSSGFPGLGLWVAFLSALAWYGLTRYRETGSPYAMALILVVVWYSLRGGVDSIFGKHVLQEFMMCVGLLLGAIDVESKD